MRWLFTGGWEGGFEILFSISAITCQLYIVIATGLFKFGGPRTAASHGISVEVEELRQDFRSARWRRCGSRARRWRRPKSEGVAETTVTTSPEKRDKNAAFAFATLEPENTASFVRYDDVPVARGDEYPIFRALRQ
ncbi:hypothetical protein SODALDRAFT_322291 [Sodiomyces alkalinus F11]|uniref:Uncharacterized protein n=1 Tax=Sodiomyces alkalinus (strain CBS 110278 / VKM F-3762 / F11) TaxID=1314773 RepID=A0A3N2Q389_SODAK|nr:hypothetical protein SODALDRAFT_322291 [Sodiomyces alkalinus F11]ROT41085.1 hypothetical protein SODALDRAFT_322291 [Sodiomyces alkalinus F11]